MMLLTLMVQMNYAFYLSVCLYFFPLCLHFQSPIYQPQLYGWIWIYSLSFSPFLFPSLLRKNIISICDQMGVLAVS